MKLSQTINLIMEFSPSKAAMARSRAAYKAENAKIKKEKQEAERKKKESEDTGSGSKLSLIMQYLEKAGIDDNEIERAMGEATEEELKEYGGYQEVAVKKLLDVADKYNVHVPGVREISKEKKAEKQAENIGQFPETDAPWNREEDLEYSGDLDKAQSDKKVEYKSRRLKHMVLLLRKYANLTKDEIISLLYRLDIPFGVIQDLELRDILVNGDLPTNAAELYSKTGLALRDTLFQNGQEADNLRHAESKLQGLYLQALSKIKNANEDYLPIIKKELQAVMDSDNYRECVLRDDLIIVENGSFNIIGKGSRLVVLE